ncbi:cell envelope integrity protein TolA [Pseudoduganella violacea]|uniref:Uncharacterized protein n=1 Tax=Pseudoduganella violacea TaxID=1715466 RepID=A0A7W5BBP9_9BURK|nr:cell envelope integrity protein TolA [Pseudoduganella violacea]MBB3120196.1 hypothetical protein [Pseudoduganella violacea]
MILFQFTRSHTDHHEYCEACGQRLPPPGGYGDKQPNRIGIAISVALHVLVALYFLFGPKHKIVLTPPAKEGDMVWVAPLPKEKPSKPKAQPQPEQKPTPRKTQPAKITPRIVPQRHNPNAITQVEIPEQPRTPQPPAKLTPPPPQVDDMQAMVEAARRRRGAVPSADAAPESDDDRARRIARANIMGAQGRSANGERNETGGIFDVTNKTFNSADVKFRGWNTNFKRQWLQQVHVEVSGEADIETAVVKKMIELIRKEKPGDFEWESHRLGKVVRMSARKDDEAELAAFLMKEMFPEYRRPR